MKIKKINFSSAMLMTRGLDLRTVGAIFECLPVDSRIVGMGIDPHKMCNFLIIESKEFEEIPVGHITPDLNLVGTDDNGYIRFEVQNDN